MGFTCLGRLLIFSDNTWDEIPTWSPNGEWIAFTSSRGGDADIFVTDVDGSNIRQLTNNPSNGVVSCQHPITFIGNSSLASMTR